MTTDEYIAELTRLLYSLPNQEREEAVAFYRESIADRMDDGLSEEEAVASMGSPAEAACAILSNRAESAPVDDVSDEAPEPIPDQPSFWQRLKHGQLTPFEWVGVVLGSVIWLPLLAAAFGVAVGAAAVVLSLYLCVWVLIGCVWIIGGAMVIAAPANQLFVFWGLQVGNAPYALVNVGYSLFAFGVGVWVLRGALALTKLFLHAHEQVACAVRKQPLPPQPVKQAPRPGVAAFFNICLIIAGVGLVSVAAGYTLSGFDWRIFLTSVDVDGTLTIGGTSVSIPERFLPHITTTA